MPAELTETNRDTVADAFAAWQSGVRPITELFAPQMTWEIAGRSRASGHYADKQAFIDGVLAPFAARFAGGEAFRPVVIRGIQADGDTVVVTWDGHGIRTDGKPYDNTYSWTMRLDDGLVVDGLAFYDSIAFDELWTEVTPGA
jgi:ketosteroid isomerase-like protein